MPGYKGHLAGGMVLFAALIYGIQSAGMMPENWYVLPWAVSIMAGSLFPDIDVKSKGQNLFYLIILGLLIALLAYGYHRSFMMVSIAGMVPMVVRHRGLFHQLWFVVAMPTFIAGLAGIAYPVYTTMIYSCAFFFVMGAVSHLWLDLGLKRMIGW